MRNLTILIDGPSGSGKTTFANKVAAETGIPLVHLDDFYPGWAGLRQAAAMVTETVLDPVAPGYVRWDWEKDQPGEWVDIDPGRDLIVEGVGALTHSSYEAAKRLGDVLTVRITAPYELRKDRALKRDPGYVDFWDMWAEQERELYSSEPPVAADVVLQWNGRG
ncbi:(d)CMP kinase [Corynebacterium lubricantis]|uniref:(d)CMP kinase n=1 Tax=Corynebacterium lubricantis TaxID=541095 RepID=UPI00035CF1C7|nr:(d)CMP kinase [Corynebacterium lubricantis]